MKQILEEYCSKNSGLLLLSMPTGFGKTHSILEFIYTHHQSFLEQNRKILFITNLKKNLPINELKDFFIKNGKNDEFDKNVLFLDSNFDSCLKSILSITNEIPDYFKQEAYKKLSSNIEILHNKNLPKNVKDRFEKDIREEYEPAFRKFIKNILYERFKTKKLRLNAIKNDKKYQWIGKIYPAVFSDERTVIFLSMDKFVHKNTTIIEDSYYFHEKFIDNSLIFIDEFDATKERVLQNIIDSGLRHRVDLLNLFLNIHRHLKQIQCPEVLLKESEHRQRRSDGKDWLSLRDNFNEFCKKADDIFNTYNLQYTCKSREKDKKRNFLFYDYQFHNVLNRNKLILIDQDLDNRINYLKTCDINDRKVGIGIDKLLRDIAGFLTYFQRGIGYIAENYYYLKKEDNDIQEEFTLESSVKTVLNEFRLNSNDDIEFLTRNIMENQFPYGLKSDKTIIENQGFYSTGFRYHDIVDNDEHDTLSKIYMFSFDRTPESFLKGICSKAMVIGVSATARVNTNIGNYDLDYLKSCLGNSFFTIQKEDLAQLKNNYFEVTQGYDQVTIKSQFIGSDRHQEALNKLEELLNDQEAANDLYNKVKSKSEDNNQFVFCRYVSILIAWKYFLDNSDCRGFLCFLNKFPKMDDPELDLRLLHEFADLMLQDNQILANESISDIMIVLSSNDFEDSKNKLLNDLQQKKRRFIFSTYQTIGVGQNLQFEIPDDIVPIQINNFSKNKKIDINGIYLDLPTNLIVNVKSFSNEDEFVKYIYQLEFFRENGSISPKVFKQKLNDAFQKYIGQYEPKLNVERFISLYKTNSYSCYVNKIIIQAIGRICRTNMKFSSIHILANSSLQEYLANFVLPQDMIPVHEYNNLLQSANKQGNASDALQESIKEAENRASNRSNWCTAYVNRQLSTRWTKQSIEEWKNLREQVLLHPTFNKETECSSQWRNIYLKLPQPSNLYYFSQENDYRNVEVFFNERKPNKNNIQTVCEKTARLPELLKIDILNKQFIKSGWATTFSLSELMLTPPMFNNIYKGALGEKSGECIFKEILDIKLLELEEHEFENFDFKIDDNIYVDFKLWNDRYSIVDAESEISKIIEKMEKIQANYVFIINIIGSSTTKFHPNISNQGRIIEIPYLCKNGSIDLDAITFISKKLGELKNEHQN